VSGSANLIKGKRIIIDEKVAASVRRIDEGANWNFASVDASRAAATAKYEDRMVGEGKVKRFLYLLASSSEEESDSEDSPGQRNS